MHTTVDQIGEFNLHDAPVQQVTRANGSVEIRFEFVVIGKNHQLNSAGKAQLIRPFVLRFENVLNESVQLWNEKERKFEAHPHPESPISEEVSEFEFLELEGMLRAKLTGFHIPSGWSEWNIECKSVTAFWEKFDGDAWYES